MLSFKQFLLEGKNKPLNPAASYHHNDIHRILQNHGWFPSRSGKHIIYKKEGVPQTISVSHGKGEMKRDMSAYIIKNVLKYTKKD